MARAFSRYFWTVCWLTITLWVAPACARQGPAEELDKSRQRYASASQTATGIFVRNFDKVETQIRRARLATDAKAARLEALRAEKSAFLDAGVLPTSAEMLLPLLRYESALDRARKPLRVTYRRLMEQAIQKNDDQLLSDLNDARLQESLSLAGDSDLNGGSNWAGFRTDGKSSMDIKLHIKERSGSTFDGTARQGQHNTEAYWIAGLLDGNSVSFWSTQTIRGKKRALRFVGFVVGNRLLVQLSGVGANGKPVSGVAVLQRN